MELVIEPVRLSYGVCWATRVAGVTRSNAGSLVLKISWIGHREQGLYCWGVVEVQSWYVALVAGCCLDVYDYSCGASGVVPHGHMPCKTYWLLVACTHAGYAPHSVCCSYVLLDDTPSLCTHSSSALGNSQPCIWAAIAAAILSSVCWVQRNVQHATHARASSCGMSTGGGCVDCGQTRGWQAYGGWPARLLYSNKHYFTEAVHSFVRFALLVCRGVLKERTEAASLLAAGSCGMLELSHIYGCGGGVVL